MNTILFKVRIFMFYLSLSLLNSLSFSYAASDEVDHEAFNQLIHHCREKSNHARKALDLQLSDAITRISAFTVPTISKTGDKVYLAYENNPGLNAAELFDNVDGKLISSGTPLLVDPAFPNFSGGNAAPDFNRFSYLDIKNPTTNPNNARIRILDENLNVIKFRLFTVPMQTVFPFSSNFVGGIFSEDGKYVCLTYVNNPLDTNAISTILVLSASDLSTVAENNNISGFTGNSPIFFTLKDKKGHKNLYIYFLSAQGQATANPLESIANTVLPPYFDQVYKVDVDAGTIKLVDQLELPKFAETDVLSRGPDALIAHGGFQSSFPDSKSIYEPLPPQLSTPPSQFLTRLPGDNAEVRVSIFDGEKLRVAFKQALDNCELTTIYPPGLGCSYCIGQNTYFTETPGSSEVYGFQSEFYCLASIEKNSDGKHVLRPQNLPNQEGNHDNTVFSADGKWLLRVGEYGYNVPPHFKPLPDALGIRNIILKKVTSDCYTPVCKICTESKPKK